jgi:hypothetical protein
MAVLDRDTPDAVAPAGAAPRAHNPVTHTMTLANRSLAVTGGLLMSHGRMMHSFQLEKNDSG